MMDGSDEARPPVGIFGIPRSTRVALWDLAGQILEANDAFLRIVGYEREDLVSGVCAGRT